MINIKLELKNVVEQTMIPESKAFLDELNELISSNNACNDDIEAKIDEMAKNLKEYNGTNAVVTLIGNTRATKNKEASYIKIYKFNIIF